MPTRLVQESRHPAGHAGLIVVDPSLVGRNPSALRLMIIKTGEVESFLDPKRPDEWSATQISFEPARALANPQGLVFDVDDTVTYSLRANSSYRLRVADGAATVLEHGFAMPTSFRRRSKPGSWSPPQSTDPSTADASHTREALEQSANSVSLNRHSALAASESEATSSQLLPESPASRRQPLVIAVVALALIALAVTLLLLKPWERSAPTQHAQVPERTPDPRSGSTDANGSAPRGGAPEPTSNPPSGAPSRNGSPGVQAPKSSPLPPEAPSKEPGVKQAPTDPRTSPQTSPDPGNESRGPPQAPRPTQAPGQSSSAALPQDLTSCRGWLQGNPPAVDARQLAQQLSAAGRMPDCQLLLSRYAANQGDREGARIMGLMSDPATWTANSSALPAPDASAAERWYRLAAGSGDVESQYRLGILLKSGQPAADRQAEAIHWLRKAAEAGHAASKRELSQ
jgi:hypothetical protein